MTKRWCSPEVAAQKPRGRAADIFSLGCVFSVMYTALLGASLTDYERDREESGEGDAFHLAIPQVKKWLDTFQEGDQGNWRWSPCGLFLNLLKEMISEDPEGRPPAGEVAERLEHGYRCDFDVWRCCSALPESYRFAEEGAMSTSFVSG
jgi:serine/threonine protein kinase